MKIGTVKIVSFCVVKKSLCVNEDEWSFTKKSTTSKGNYF